MIKRIELVNFMSHEHSVFELTEGLNVLVGPNNCGKSAVVTALQILCYNDPSKYALRHDSKECSIQLETDDGHVVRWARKKSGSPYYEIDGQRFDRLGKNGVPELLHQVLRLDRVASDKDHFDVHFGEQRNPVFLLNEKPRQAADFFASSSDAKHLLEMQSLHKQNVRDSNMQLKRLQREAVELEASLNQLQPLEQLVVRMDQAEQLGQRLDETEQQRLHLVNLCHGLDELQKETAIRERKLKYLDSIPAPPQFQSESQLETLIESLKTAEQQCVRLRKQSETLESLVEPPELTAPDELDEIIESLEERQHDFRYLTEKVRLLDTLKLPPKQIDESELVTMSTRLSQHFAAQKRLQKQAMALQGQLVEVEGQIQAWAEANPACPTCGGDVTMQQLIAGGHQHGD